MTEKTNDLESDLKRQMVEYIDLSMDDTLTQSFERKLFFRDDIFKMLLGYKSDDLKTMLKERHINAELIFKDIDKSETAVAFLRQARFAVLYDNVMRQPDKKQHPINRTPKKKTAKIQNKHAKEIHSRILINQHSQEFKDYIIDDWINDSLADDFKPAFPRMDSMHKKNDYELDLTPRGDIVYFIANNTPLRMSYAQTVCDYVLHKQDITNPVVRDDFNAAVHEPYMIDLMNNLEQNRDVYERDRNYKKIVKFWIKMEEENIENPQVNPVKPRKRTPRH